MKRFIIRHKWAMGDTILLTALVRDIHRAYPKQYEIQVDTHFTNVWWNNPHVTRFQSDSKAIKVDISWGDAISWNGYAKHGNRREMTHILAWYHYDFFKKTGIHVPVTDPYPDLHLSSIERARRIQGRYWVILSGGKLDLTTKHWHTHRAQEVVDKLRQQGITCVQVGVVHTSHVHPPLKNCVNLLGKTENVRDLWNIILHSDGVICGVTGAMHIAAAFEKPCVVYAGGREEPWFEAYVNAFSAFGPNANPVKVEHKFLHTIGLLDCCDKQGCWKKRTIPIDQQDLTSKSYTLCRQPVRPHITHAVAKCQDLILSDHIIEAVMDYYDKNVLPPIGVPKSFPLDSIPELAANAETEIRIPKVELVRVHADDVVPKTEVQIIRTPSTDNREQKPQHQVHPREIARNGYNPVQRNLAILDHHTIGGKVTICVLCYGPHTDLARKCLSSIMATVPAERMDLRVATNEAAPTTIDYLKTLPISKLYINSTNRHKYPVMREMFWDTLRPIETNYVIWFDDDTWAVQPNWLSDLAQSIIDGQPYGYRLYGTLLSHDLAMYAKNGGRPADWFRAAGWYRGKQFRARGGAHETPNGSAIDFAVGWCWALATETMRQADIPDVRLGHNGGDITIGEQVHQTGFLIKQWNKGKKLIACPSREQGGRRGYSEKFPWDRN